MLKVGNFGAVHPKRDDNASNCADGGNESAGLIDQWEEQLAKRNAVKTPVTKRKRSATVKKPPKRTSRLQSSAWYEKAARSIGITENRLPHSATTSPATPAYEAERRLSR